MITVGKRKLMIRRLKGKRMKTPNPPPPWLELPDDVTANILQRLGAVEILETAQKVCTHWRRVCQDPSMWRHIDIAKLGDLDDMPYNLEIMCRQAVDLSQGQLIDINLEFFGTDDLLWYIAERCSHLKCLRLAFCNDISAECLIKVVKQFPELEELHLFFMKCIDEEDIEIFGTSCPMLKSFSLNDRGYNYPTVIDSYINAIALAVAKSMPNLRHLQLFGDTMKNEGLEAILNSCPYLESLDIRQCFSIDLSGDLGKRCSKQIKYLRGPNDSTDDYKWDCYVNDDHHLYDDHHDYYSSDLSYDGSFNFSDYSDEYEYDDYGIDYGFDQDDYFPMGSP